MSESEILEKFKEIVAKSLRIDRAQITLDKHLDELGAESLDLMEITMEAESRFNIWLPERSILQTAIEVFGPGVLENDGVLTEAGKRLLRRRLPDSDTKWFQGDVSVRDLQRYFLKISTWVRMIESFIQHPLADYIAVIGDDQFAAMTAGQIGHHSHGIRQMQMHYVGVRMPYQFDHFRADRRSRQIEQRSGAHHAYAADQVFSGLAVVIGNHRPHIDHRIQVFAQRLKVGFHSAHVRRIKFSDL